MLQGIAGDRQVYGGDGSGYERAAFARVARGPANGERGQGEAEPQVQQDVGL